MLVPRGKIEIYKGETYLINEFIDGKVWKEFIKEAKFEEIVQAKKELKKHFVLDCLFGNWDVLGADNDNVIVDSNLKTWRIDNAGSLQYRAKGEKKRFGQWGDYVSELTTMIDSEMNPTASKIFKDITQEEIQEQIQEIQKRKNEILYCLSDQDKITISKRIDYLSDILKNDVKSQWDDQLKILEDMGFTNTSENIKYLNQSGGNVEYAINQNLKNL